MLQATDGVRPCTKAFGHSCTYRSQVVPSGSFKKGTEEFLGSSHKWHLFVGFVEIEIVENVAFVGLDSTKSYFKKVTLS